MFGATKTKDAPAPVASAATLDNLDASERAELEALLAERRAQRQQQSSAEAEERRRHRPAMGADALQYVQAGLDAQVAEAHPSVVAEAIGLIAKTIAGEFARSGDAVPGNYGMLCNVRDRLMLLARALGGEQLQQKCARTFPAGSQQRRVWGGDS